MKRILLSGLAAVMLTSCSINVLNNATISPGIAFEVLKQETIGGREAESKQVIYNQTQLNDLYKELGWTNVPYVDFNKNNVVAIFMGQKSTGGYSISVRKVSVDGDTATVYVKTTKPEGMATMAITTPYTITLIPKTKEVVVEE
ncbi:protease complex subunit PrcB family protein [Flavobacterium akiainvivens]|uniref:protease complex subunit PrcB family protein n=1 Tax=Flavobacterium akiainvivens TaxID=1202724 RepID=UPI0006C864A9|nr:protease complex subunit PrcB family protein [Flavobacterium akiainvivens]SFQ73926.1 PrcB C-terminal [Flavobacterium akiainvivens]